MLIVSEVRFLRDSLAEVLARLPTVQICGQAASLAQAVAAVEQLHPSILLLDVGLPGGRQSAAKFSAEHPAIRVVAFGIAETEEHVLAWTAAGIAGYVPNTASVDDLIALVEQIANGEQSCSPRIAGSLLRRLRAGFQAALTPDTPPLTPREQEIFDLIGAGLSNKAIARRLSISLGTAKSHVHNVLNKLKLQRRAEVMTRLHSSHPSAP
jgi:DNA-binding NarL/FixJ family response regulator